MQRMLGGSVLNCGISGTTISQNSGEFDYLSLHCLSKSINNGNWDEVKSACERLAAGELRQDYRSTADKLSLIDWNSVNYLILFYGTNDFSNNLPIGNENDFQIDTLVGAINYSIKKIHSKYPKIKIIFVSPIWRARFLDGDDKESDTNPNKKGIFLINYVDSIIKTSLSNKIPCIDMYRTSGINKYNYTSFLSDGIHPTEGGEERIADKIFTGIICSY
uniref:Uncharacterized protein n=1 Tax=Yersinia similis TaxID=367190 RepID=S0F2M1_9GAMM|nr:hypothetical protein [Yersinia similis]